MEVDSGVPVPGPSKPKHDIIIKQEVCSNNHKRGIMY